MTQTTLVQMRLRSSRAMRVFVVGTAYQLVYGMAHASQWSKAQFLSLEIAPLVQVEDVRVSR